MEISSTTMAKVAALYLIFDLPWIGYFGRGLYTSVVKDIQGSTLTPRLAGAVGAYLFLTIGMTYIVIANSKDRIDAAKKGALFGLVLYGVFDFTNLAMFNNWNWTVTVVDIIWGTMLSALVAYLAF